MKLHIVRHDEVAARDGHPLGHAVAGGVRGRFVSGPDFPLWQVALELEAGATLDWPDEHGDEGVYLVDGELEVAGTRLPPGGAVVVEAGAPCRARAVRRCALLHCGSTVGPRGPRKSREPRVEGALHVVGPEGRWRTARGDVVSARWFADGTCSRCSIQLFQVRHRGQGTEQRGVAHSHSQDEIVHVLEGSVRLGSHTCGPGASLCIPAGVRYAIVGGPDGHTFLNYRRDVSYLTTDSERPPALETAAAQGGIDAGGLLPSPAGPPT